MDVAGRVCTIVDECLSLGAPRKVSRRIGFEGGLLVDFTGEESGGDVYAVGLVVIGL